MFDYQIDIVNAESHFIDFKFEIPCENRDKVELNFPSWRPGRYEMADFAQYIRNFKVYGKSGKELDFRKVKKDSWEINCSGESGLIVKYEFFADTINAGSTYLGSEQLYVNPVNCFFFLPDVPETPYRIELIVPDNFQFATSLKREGKSLRAANYQELFDSPFIASPTLKHFQFDCKGSKFNLWFQGESKPDEKRIINDFKKYTAAQIDAFGGFPVEEYHYLIQILPFPVYHGVEHLESTVIALGPSFEVFGGNLYNKLLGVCSHELYHAWNVKTIRPVEMMPYRFNQENYSVLGYVAEGVTSYMGDQFLYRSEVFDWKTFKKTLEERIQRYYDAYKGVSLSLAESAYDTWLDGYKPGVTGRKLSIYNEGCLFAFILDVLIMEYSKNKKSLDNLMKELFNDFGKVNKGYTEEDFKSLGIKYGGKKAQEAFEDLVYGTGDYKTYLNRALEYLGWNLNVKGKGTYLDEKMGLKCVDSNGYSKVVSIANHSPAERVGVISGDIIHSVNDYNAKSSAEGWFRYFKNESIKVGIIRNNELQFKEIKFDDKIYFPKVDIALNKGMEKNDNFKFWKTRK